jgi:hypothetical protein
MPTCRKERGREIWMEKRGREGKKSERERE